MRHLLRSIFVPLLLAAVVGLAAVEVSQPLDLHKASSAGLYNEEHVLAALDSVSGDAPLPHVPGAIWLPLAAGAALFAADRSGFTTPLRHTDPRAPPLA
jgi:hypothetical protein